MSKALPLARAIQSSPGLIFWELGASGPVVTSLPRGGIPEGRQMAQFGTSIPIRVCTPFFHTPSALPLPKAPLMLVSIRENKAASDIGPHFQSR